MFYPTTKQNENKKNGKKIYIELNTYEMNRNHRRESVKNIKYKYTEPLRKYTRILSI